jgi:hypothetical protein
VYVFSHGGIVTFTKKGGTIYGDTDAIAGNGSPTDNTVISGSGHAVGLYFLYNSTKGRNSTAGPAVKLYARYSSDWTFNDTSSGGVGDTTANWEG